MAWQGEGGSDTAEQIGYDKARLENLKCQSGDTAHCSYGEQHPVELAATVIAGYALMGVGVAAVGEVTTAGMISAGSTAASAAEGASIACGGDCSDEINTGINTVYRVIENGKPIYVGITQNLEQRASY